MKNISKELHHLAKIMVTLTCAKESFEELGDTNVYILEEMLKEVKKKTKSELKRLNIKTITLNPTGNRKITLSI